MPSEPSGDLAARALPRRPPPPGVAAVADALEERLDDLVADMLESILHEVPVYRERGTAVEADTRRAAAYVYASLIDGLRTGSPPNAAVANSLADVGADRAAQGIPLGDLLQAFRISARTATDRLTRVASERDLDRDAALWVAEAILTWIDVVSNLAAASYSRTQARLLDAQEDRRRDFLLDLLYGAITGEEALERAEELAWDPATSYWVGVLGRADPASPEDQAAVVEALGHCFPLRTHGTLVVLVPATTVDDVAEIERRALAAAASRGLAAGIAEVRSGVAGVRRTHLEATEALAIAQATGEPFVRYSDAVLDRMLRRDPELLDELVERTVVPLEEYDTTRNTELLTTLETYFEFGESPSRTAAELHTHTQTVRYRLGRVRDITGLALDDLEDRIHLILGLRGRRLRGRSSTETPPHDG